MITSRYGCCDGRRPLAGYGAANDGFNASMDDAVSALRRAVLVIRARVAAERSTELLLRLTGPLGFVATLFTSTADAKASALSGLNTIDSIIARLNGPSRQEVLAGTMAPGKWAASAQTVAEGIEAQLKILNENSTLDMLQAQLEQMVKDFEALGAKITSGVSFTVPLLVVGGVALAIFLGPKLLAASPVGRVARSLSGHNKRIRRSST